MGEHELSNGHNKLCQTGVLNKDPTVWLGGARPANANILPGECALAVPWHTRPKNTFANIKN